MPTHLRFSTEGETALPLAVALAERRLLVDEHVAAAFSPAGALQAALRDIVEQELGNNEDAFSVDISIADRLDEYRKPNGEVIFFIWNHAMDPQYIPLRPIYERLETNPLRERLVASLYEWLYSTAARMFDPFGFSEAQSIYEWRRDLYLTERENGEDVDLEGEVEYADPVKVVGYIRNSAKLILKPRQVKDAIKSIADLRLRDAFERAHAMYLQSRPIHLPKMASKCAQLVHEAAYYMDGSPFPALGISHWRDDPIVAWFDECCREQFEAGTDPRAPIILGFHPQGTRYFMQIVKCLKPMIRAVAALSWWVRFSEELENASHYADRDGQGLPAEAGGSDL